jgi:hypothetical protein
LFTDRGARQGIYPTLIIVLVSLNLAQDRVPQGPTIDTGLKFGSCTGHDPQSTCTRTVSFTLAHTATSSAVIASEADLESGGSGIELVTGARTCRVDDSKMPEYGKNSDLKGIFVHQVTDVS